LYPRNAGKPHVILRDGIERVADVTVGTIVGLVAAGRSFNDILPAYPYIDAEDIRQALSYAAWRVEELEALLPIV
jgi:uncharacterized protein (DUF433 family)